MYRYIALVWDESNRERSDAATLVKQRIKSTATDWSVACEASGLVVLHTDIQPPVDRAYPLSDAAGTVIGTLFDRRLDDHAALAKPVLGEQETRAIVETRARHLVENYWGSYVAFVRNPQKGRAYVLRAPAGRLPCLSLTFRGIDIYFSRTEDCIQLAIGRFSTDWSYVVRHIVCRGLQRLSGTGIKEVSQVAEGECITLTGDVRTRATYWDPVRIAETSIVEDEAEAVRELREVTRACVAAWASCHRSIILFLSGGLDSSIILSCLMRAPTRPEITCVNYVGPNIEGDERKFARLAARHAGTELIEHFRDHSNVKMDAVMAVERTALPLIYSYHILNGPLESQLAREYGSTATFTGFLGDSIFHRSATKYATADYVQLHGIGSRLPKIALDSARRERRLFWSVLFGAIRNRLSPPPFRYYSGVLDNLLLLSPDVASSIDQNELIPPLVRTTRGVPYGKLQHILTTFLPYVYHDPLGSPDRKETVPPLVSQPLLELCFRIPTYVLSAGGKGRAIARLAFASAVPSQIINRRTKGAGTIQGTKFLAANRAFLRDLLVDGMLVREGILNRAAVEKCLATPEAVSNSVAAELPAYYSTEVWLRRWADTKEKLAVA